MPSIFTPIPSEIERKAPGTGGKPPVDRRPTGGGGGGGDDEWRNPRRGPREVLHRTRAFVFCALAGDMMFFVVLVALFYARQAGTHMDPAPMQQIGDWHPILLPPILFLNTAVLLLSSLTMELARRHIFREFDVLEEWLGLGSPALRRTLPWVGATLALGLAFLAGQVMPGGSSPPQGFAFDRWATPASYFFYVITGLHAAHLARRRPRARSSASSRSPASSASNPARSLSTQPHGSGTPWASRGSSSLRFLSSGNNPHPPPGIVILSEFARRDGRKSRRICGCFSRSNQPQTRGTPGPGPPQTGLSLWSGDPSSAVAEGPGIPRQFGIRASLVGRGFIHDCLNPRKNDRGL